MNAVEIEQAVSDLAERAFVAADFPFQFLQAFGVSDAAIAKLRGGKDNKSDVPDAVLQRSKNNIHLMTCPPGEVDAAMAALRASSATAKLKPRFLLATDGQAIRAERTSDTELLACDYSDLPNRFAYFLSLAGISTVKRIDENAFDIRATGRLNKLYVELLRHNPDWGTDARRQDLNHFFARLIFCFFAEDTNIFVGGRLFTDTVDQMTERNGSNVHEVLGECFRAMDTKPADRPAATLRPFANTFPYVNGNLFGGSCETPRFSQVARTYLLFVGNLDWTRINPDIFGSMIQAVADDEERGALGMHYTSVPNILKVLNPLFLDELRRKFDEAWESPIKLLNLRKRMSRIRVFDPACGSGNFLVIAYKQMRAIEAEINGQRGETDRKSEIPVSNFRGIELRHFPAEIARLALIIAEFQCDVLYRGEQLARAEFLPLDQANWITCGNALRLDWLTVCPPTGTGVKLASDDLYGTPKDQAEIDFANEGGETYICGNPPYQGSVNQTVEQKFDMEDVFASVFDRYKDLDYVAAFLLKAARYNRIVGSSSAFVATNSISQGEQVAMLWPLVFDQSNAIHFAHTSFSWSNLASNKAAVTCVIVGLSTATSGERRIFDGDAERKVANISPYIVAADSTIVRKRSTPVSNLGLMQTGNMPTDNGNLILSDDERDELVSRFPETHDWLKRYVGSRELINGGGRWCLWIDDGTLGAAMAVPAIRERISGVETFRSTSRGKQANDHSDTPHRFVFAPHSDLPAVAIPKVSSIRREFLPCDVTSAVTVVSNLASVIYDAAIWNLSIIASRLHLVWIATVCGKMKTDYRYSNTLGWNTFPVPPLKEQYKAELTRCAEDILLAREAHFPATIADLYDPERMDAEFPDLRAAHERNDETLERIYIGRRFRNDTERLETLFQMYTDMTAKATRSGKSTTKRKAKGA